MDNGTRTRDLRNHNPALNSVNALDAHTLGYPSESGYTDGYAGNPDASLQDSRLTRLVSRWSVLPQTVRQSIDHLVCAGPVPLTAGSARGLITP